jgi:hypothetical protein
MRIAKCSCVISGLLRNSIKVRANWENKGKLEKRENWEKRGIWENCGF